MPTEDQRPLLNVVAGILADAQGRVLLTSRPEGKAYAGYWEFAGGKVETGETDLAALQREFREELGVRILAARPWLTRIHSYEHARVRLRFFRVAAQDWQDEIQAHEGQQWVWQQPGAYTVSPMLPANAAILQALTVPDTLSGSLRHGFSNGGGYRVVPYADSSPAHPNLLLNQADLARLGKLPAARSIWIAVETPEQWHQAQDADVVVWAVRSAAAAETLCAVLADGAALPVVVLADPVLLDRFADRWLAAGAQAVVADRDVRLA